MPEVWRMRTPTEGQFRRLASAGTGSVMWATRRSEWGPLLRAGWVERFNDDSPRGGSLPPLRITAEGYRALGAALDRHGWPT